MMYVNLIRRWILFMKYVHGLDVVMAFLLKIYGANSYLYRL
jgi:hypothetical protein